MQVCYTGSSLPTSIMPLNFAWPWLERRSVTAGRRSLNSHLSRALCSHPAMILLRSACRICQLSFGPYCHPVASTSAVLYTWTWQPIQPAACRLIQLAQPQSHNRLCCSGLVKSTQMIMIGCLYSCMPIFVWVPIYAKIVSERKWVPIFMGAYIRGVPIIRNKERADELSNYYTYLSTVFTPPSLSKCPLNSSCLRKYAVHYMAPGYNKN